MSFFLHWHNFWRIKFTPEKCVNYDKIHSKLPIFCVITSKYTEKLPIFRVRSVKIYTGQKKFTRTLSVRPWQIWGMQWVGEPDYKYVGYRLGDLGQNVSELLWVSKYNNYAWLLWEWFLSIDNNQLTVTNRKVAPDFSSVVSHKLRSKKCFGGLWLEHKTCDILAAERLRLMIFDNRLIIESFHKSNVYSNGNFGRVFYIIQDSYMSFRVFCD